MCWKLGLGIDQNVWGFCSGFVPDKPWSVCTHTPVFGHVYCETRGGQGGTALTCSE